MWEHIPMDEINATKRMIRIRNADHQRLTAIFNRKDTRYHPNPNLSLRSWLKSPSNPERNNVLEMEALGWRILRENTNWSQKEEEEEK